LRGKLIPDVLAQEVDEIVRGLRPTIFSPFEIEPTARKIGVRLERRRLGRELLGLTLDSDRILLNRNHPPGTSAAFTFAHELAHVFERRGAFSIAAPAGPEWFADYFARELLVPRQWLFRDGPNRIEWLATRRWAGPSVVALQAARCNLAPAVFRHDAAVLCRDCGERHPMPECPCVAIRARPSRVRRLPQLSEILRAITEPTLGFPLQLAI
jgi:IrrE N-terminal-like domain